VFAEEVAEPQLLTVHKTGDGSPSASRECTIDLSSGDKTAEVEYVE